MHRIAERGRREARVQQRADAQDRGGQHAEEEEVFRAAGADERPEDQAPDGAAGQRVAEDLACLPCAPSAGGFPVAFAEAEEDQDGAGVAPHEHDRHDRLGPEGEGEDAGVEEVVDGGERGKVVEAAPAGGADGFLAARSGSRPRQGKGFSSFPNACPGLPTRPARRFLRVDLEGKMPKQRRYSGNRSGEI